MIQVNNLTKRYGSHVAVNNISFSVSEGEILGFLGPNGAGKTTTMNMLTGYMSCTDGTITINGHDILEDPNAAKACIGYLPEHPPLYLDMTVREYLNFIFDLKQCKFSRRKHLGEICKLVQIEHVYDRLIKNLSKGYRQRVGFAQALIGNPPVLILDEPTVGLDPNQIIEIRALIKNLGKHHTVILSSHILQEIEAVCDRIIIINNGKLIADDTASALSEKYSADRRLLARVYGDEKRIHNVLSHVQGVAGVVAYGEKEPGVFEFALEPREGADFRRAMFTAIAKEGMILMGLRSMEMSLEEVFVSLTGEDLSKPTRKGGKRK